MIGPKLSVRMCDRYITGAVTALPGVRIFFGLLSAISVSVCLCLVVDGDVLLKADTWIWPGLTLFLAIVGMVGVTVEDVHDQRQMNRQRTDSEKKYRMLFQHCNDAIIMHDLQGQIIDANEKAFHLFDYPRADFLRSSIADLHPPEALETSQRAFSTLQRDHFVRFEIYFKKRSGDLFLAEVSSSLFEADGEQIVQGIVRDVTERKRNEEALKDIQERYQALHGRSIYGVYVHDFNGWFLDANDAALKMVGYTREEIPGIHLSSLLDENQVRKVQEEIESLRESGREKKPMEYTLRRKDGSYLFVETESSIIYRHGKPFAVQGVVQDTTRRRQIMEALQAAEQRFRTLFEDAVIGLYRTTPEGNIILANPTLVRMLGYTSLDEVTRKNLEKDGFEPEYRRAAFKQRIEREGQVIGLESIWLRRDGTEIHVRESARCTRNEAGDVLYYEGTVEDITERRRAEEARRVIEERQNSILSVLPLMLYVAETPSPFAARWVSDSVRRVTGYPASRFLEEPGFWEQHIHPEDRQDVVSAMRGMIPDKAPSLEYRWLCADGTYHWFIDRVVSAEETGSDEASRKTEFSGIWFDITEQKRAEEALRTSEQKYRTLTENINIGIYRNTPGPSGRFIEANQAIIRMFGYENKETFLRVPVADLYLNPKDRKQFSAMLSGDGFVKEETVRLRRRDGSHFWGAITAVAVLNDEGQVTFYDGVIEDITERKQAEDSLRRSEEQYRQLYECLRDASATVDMSGAIIECNSTMCQMLGYDRDELYALSYKDITPEPWHEAEAQILSEQVMNRGYSDLYEKEYVRKNGAILPVELRTYLLRDRNGAPNAMWALIRDISERKQAERAVRESEEKYRNLTDQSRDAIYLLYEGRFEIINKRFEELFGYSREETNAPTFNFMDLISPKSHPLLMERSRKIDCGEEVSPQYQFTAISRDGREIEVETSVSYVRYQGGTATQGVLRDITERVKAERALQSYALDLQRSNQDLEHFAYISSHDLQEPLRMVASYLQLLERRYADRLDSDAKEFIAYAVDGAVRMQTLINDLLTYSRVGTRGKSFQTTNCERVLEIALLNLKVAIEERNASIAHDPLPAIKGDATQLVQVFQNLIGNAIKFCKQERPDVFLSAEEKNDEWVFSVRDNGIGFDDKYSDRIFKIFQRLHTREEYAGTGAGLAICKKIVERHGGRIWAISKPGQGSTFFFTIPIQGDLPDEQPAPGQTD